MYFPELPDIHLGAPGMPLWVTAEEEPAGAQLGRNLRLPDSCPPCHHHRCPSHPSSPPTFRTKLMHWCQSQLKSPQAHPLCPSLHQASPENWRRLYCPYFTGEKTETRFPQYGKDPEKSPEKSPENPHLLSGGSGWSFPSSGRDRPSLCSFPLSLFMPGQAWSKRGAGRSSGQMAG